MPTHLHSHLLLPNTLADATKAKESASHRTATVQTVSADIGRHYFGRKRRAAGNMGLNEMAGEVLNQSVVLSIKFCGRRTVGASKPPLR